MLFWDDFSANGELGPEPERAQRRGRVCLKRDDRAAAVADDSRFCWPGIFPIARRSAAAGRRPKATRTRRHRQPLRDALRRRLGGRGVRRAASRRAGKAHAALRRGLARKHAAGGGEGRRQREPLHARHHHLLPHRRRRVPRLRRRQRSRAAAATATARTSGTTRPRPRICSRRFARSLRAAPSATRWTTRGAMHFRQMLPDGIERFGLRRGRRADGPDHARLSRLAALAATTHGCASSGPG